MAARRRPVPIGTAAAGDGFGVAGGREAIETLAEDAARAALVGEVLAVRRATGSTRRAYRLAGATGAERRIVKRAAGDAVTARAANHRAQGPGPARRALRATRRAGRDAAGLAAERAWLEVRAREA